MQTASEIAAAVTYGKASASTAVDASLKRIDALDGALRAWVRIDREGAARTAGAGPTGALAGVPAGVKDIIDVAGLTTGLGSPEVFHFQPTQDAVAIARLRAAGGVILGKTETTQFAFLDTAPTHNPWRLDCTPGGSSSGSAAAVGAGMVPLALGTQTVGSVLRPAAYCGIVGLKPTFGRIPYAGIAYLAPSFDHLGVLCRSVADAALALSVLAGRDVSDANSLSAPVDDYLASLNTASAPRIGILRSYYRDSAGDEVKRHLDDVAQRLAAAGATVTEAEMPANAEDFRVAGEAVLRFEAASVHRERFAAHPEGYRPGIRALVEAGLATSEADCDAGRKALADLREATVALYSTHDVLLMPTAPSTAPGIETTGSGIYCAPASFTGLPAIALPSGLGADGLPLSIQLMAAPLAEARLLAAAAWVERVFDFRAEPPLPAS